MHKGRAPLMSCHSWYCTSFSVCTEVLSTQRDQMTVPEGDPTRAIIECAVPSWFPRYQHLAHGMRVIPVEQDVVEWLISDGISVPEDSDAVRWLERMTERAALTKGHCMRWPIVLDHHRSPWILIPYQFVFNISSLEEGRGLSRESRTRRVGSRPRPPAARRARASRRPP